MASIIGVETLQHTNGTTAATIDSSGFILPKTPALAVEATDVDQSVPAATSTKVDWETATLDTLNGWDATNNRYTPTVAGWYAYGGVIRGNFSSILQYFNTQVRKNGVDSPLVNQTQFQFSGDQLNNGSIPIATGLVEMNGSSDYIEVLVAADEAVTISDNSTSPSTFFMYLVHAT